MKKIITITMALIMLTSVGKSQSRPAAALKDPGQREAILDSIAGNSLLLQKVNEKARAKGTMSDMKGMHNMQDMQMGNMNGMQMGGDTAKMNMMNNPAMMNNMMDMMMEQCSKDTAMCRQMCTKMMNTPKMKDMMQHMMNNKSADSANMKMNH